MSFPIVLFSTTTLVLGGLLTQSYRSPSNAVYSRLFLDLIICASVGFLASSIWKETHANQYGPVFAPVLVLSAATMLIAAYLEFGRKSTTHPRLVFWIVLTGGLLMLGVVGYNLHL